MTPSKAARLFVSLSYSVALGIGLTSSGVSLMATVCILLAYGPILAAAMKYNHDKNGF